MPKESFASSGLVGQLISLDLMVLLAAKGLISEAEVRNLADQALLTLEKWRTLFPENHQDFDHARGLLEDYARFPAPSGRAHND